MNIFGYQLFPEKKEEQKVQPSPIEPFDDGGSINLNSSGFFGTYFDLNANAYANESELIARYRDIANYPDVDNAVEEITTEVIAAVDHEVPVKINTNGLEYSDKIKKSIEEEFNNVLRLLDFKKKGHDIFKRWYVDGRLYYQKVIDTSKRKKESRN